MLKNIKNGFTLVEALVVIFLVTIISSIVFMNLSQFRKEQVLRSTASNIVTFLNKAKQNTLSSINSLNYGIHFESNKMILFAGSTYISSDPNNEIVIFDSAVSIPTSGGLNIGSSNDVIFTRLTGETTGGTIKLQLNSNTDKYKTIIISKTGLISSN